MIVSHTRRPSPGFPGRPCPGSHVLVPSQVGPWWLEAMSVLLLDWALGILGDLIPRNPEHVLTVVSTPCPATPAPGSSPQPGPRGAAEGAEGAEQTPECAHGTTPACMCSHVGCCDRWPQGGSPKSASPGQNQGISRAWLPLGPEGVATPPSCSFRWLLESLGLWPHHSSLSGHTVCASLCKDM